MRVMLLIVIIITHFVFVYERADQNLFKFMDIFIAPKMEIPEYLKEKSDDEWLRSEIDSIKCIFLGRNEIKVYCDCQNNDLSTTLLWERGTRNY